MKKIILLGAILISFMGQAQESTGTTVTVTISNIPGDEGKAIISLFNEKSFMKAPPLEKGTAEIKDGKASFIFEGIAPGEYGVISFHDKNDNNQIDMQPNGMPTEAYGVSNNPMSFGPPQWSEAKFEVKNEPISLEIRY
jgi:uncharacterized protein (DUF2141 family)